MAKASTPAPVAPAPSADDLAALGVEVGVEPAASTVQVREPRRLKFAMKPRPDKPGERELTLETGHRLGERVILAYEGAQNVAAPVPDATAPTVEIHHLSYALLDDKGKVRRRTSDGRPMIATAYPITLTAENVGRLGSKAKLKEVIASVREIAAAQAQMEFEGMILADEARSPESDIWN